MKHLIYLFIVEKDREANENRSKIAWLPNGIRTRITAGQCPPMHHRVHHICPHILLKMIKLEVLSKTFPSKLFFRPLCKKRWLSRLQKRKEGLLGGAQWSKFSKIVQKLQKYCTTMFQIFACLSSFIQWSIADKLNGSHSLISETHHHLLKLAA